MQNPHQSFRLAGGLAPGVSDLSAPQSILTASCKAMCSPRLTGICWHCCTSKTTTSNRCRTHNHHSFLFFIRA